MSVQDMIKKSVLESGVFDSFNVPQMTISLVVALLLGAVIYMVYSKFYVGVIFSRSFAVTLVGMTLLTCMVTLAISTNIVISLGMVGALSIVRFRTAVKDPMASTPVPQLAPFFCLRKDICFFFILADFPYIHLINDCRYL